MKKRIVRWGNALVIRFSAEERKIYKLKEGDILDLSDIFKIKDMERCKK